jgi:hypothetical protein
MRHTFLMLALILGMCEACGSKSATALDQEVRSSTEVVEEGGVSPFVGRLSFRSPEAMAAQEVPFAPGREDAFEKALTRYRRQWTFLLTVGPKPNAKPDPSNPLRLDIENNGGMWGDHARNLQRLMFEMGEFIRLKTPSGEEVEPSLVAFERSFGMGLDRQFLIVFPQVYRAKPLRPPFEVVVKEFGQGTGTFNFPVQQEPGALARWKVQRMWKRSSPKNEG